jgi:hypothetical protein
LTLGDENGERPGRYDPTPEAEVLPTLDMSVWLMLANPIIPMSGLSVLRFPPGYAELESSGLRPALIAWRAGSFQG